MILTSVIGMLLATDQSIPLQILVFGNLGIALCAGSAAAVNHIVDRNVDDKMARTADRPIAQGRLEPQQAQIFAMVTGIAGMAILIVFTNVLTAWLTLASSVGYAFVYTMFLKRATPQNIVIGGLAGAAPPLLGWVAVTGDIHHNCIEQNIDFGVSLAMRDGKHGNIRFGIFFFTVDCQRPKVRRSPSKNDQYQKQGVMMDLASHCDPAQKRIFPCFPSRMARDTPKSIFCSIQLC